MKICSRQDCPHNGVYQPLSCFNKDKYKKSGLKSNCRTCDAALSRTWKTRNPDKAKASEKSWRGRNKDKKRAHMIKWQNNNREKCREKCKVNRIKNPDVYREAHMRQYGLTTACYERMLDEQGGVCKICGKPETMKLHGKTKALAVDHCHDTGRVRGLLCHICNLRLGVIEKLRKDPELQASFEKYLMSQGTS